MHVYACKKKWLNMYSDSTLEVSLEEAHMQKNKVYEAGDTVSEVTPKVSDVLLLKQQSK